MIKVNLSGAARKKAVKGPGKAIALPKNLMPFVMIAIVLGTAGGGYLWYSSLSGQSAELSRKIDAAKNEKKSLEDIIKTERVYEARKAMLENRVRVIENLQKNQVSPVVSLDILSEAIDQTEYIWLSTLAQNNNNFSMSGTGSSMNAIADLMTNLKATGYFPRVELNSAVQGAGGVVTFSMSAEFLPPKDEAADKKETTAPTGGN